MSDTGNIREEYVCTHESGSFCPLWQGGCGRAEHPICCGQEAERASMFVLVSFLQEAERACLSSLVPFFPCLIPSTEDDTTFTADLPFSANILWRGPPPHIPCGRLCQSSSCFSVRSSSQQRLSTRVVKVVEIHPQPSFW